MMTRAPISAAFSVLWHAGCAKFPTTVETAQDAAAHGDDIVLGAPNVVRGGSHTGWLDAKDMVGRGLCSVLASDYYYPAPLLAAWRLATEEVVPLQRPGRWSRRPPRPPRGLRIEAPLRKGGAPT